MLKPIILSAMLCLSPIMMAENFSIDKANNRVTVAGQTYGLNSTTLLLAPGQSNSPYIFNDALKAIEAINKAGTSKVTLFVAPSVYWLDNPDDPAIRKGEKGHAPYAAEIVCQDLSIIGLAEKPEDVVFAVNRGQTQGALGNYTMLHFKGESLRTENMTFGNYCNVDLVYPRDSSMNREKRKAAIVQAQLGICEKTDRVFARNCRFISRLNLCPLTGARRSLYKDCYFECTDDALTGSAVYLDCKFTFHSGKPFYSTATTGAVFMNCDIHSLVDGVQYLTKMPGMVTMVDTRITSEKPVRLQWTRDASPIRCYQTGVTLNGQPAFIDEGRPELSTDLATSPLIYAYKIVDGDKVIYNTPNLLGGNDGWDPLGMLPAIKAAEKKLSRKLTAIPVALKIATSGRELAPQADTLLLSPSPRLWGDYPASLPQETGVKWNGPTTVRLKVISRNALVKSANSFPRHVEGIISATTTDGLVGATNIKVAPLLKDAPDFSASPTLTLNKSKLKVDYTLAAEGNDDSYIVWYRSTRPDAADSIPVRHGHGESASTYQLTSADHGYFISAAVTPKLSDTYPGNTATVKFDGEITQKISKSSPKKERILSTSFAEIPIRRGKPGRPGFWNFDSYKPEDTKEHDWKPDEKLSWYYGHATDASTGIGLVQATRGARLTYTPTQSVCKSMHISLVAEPCKGPGQGFGSATGQYMDICLKFVPQTLSGYGLRIERTPDYDKAVTFTLVHYVNGKVTPVSKPIASNCFRSPCHITLDLDESTLTATASTEAPTVESDHPDVKPYVSLSTKISVPTTHGSFAIQHTGSTGSSATLLRDLKITWE
ncbi:MAG: hypothetical protein NC411_00895 [Bacteroides sp.]|nr:hypothetical protein [Bacteroides sp.]